MPALSLYLLPGTAQGRREARVRVSGTAAVALVRSSCALLGCGSRAQSVWSVAVSPWSLLKCSWWFPGDVNIWVVWSISFCGWFHVFVSCSCWIFACRKHSQTYDAFQFILQFRLKIGNSLGHWKCLNILFSGFSIWWDHQLPRELID